MSTPRQIPSYITKHFSFIHGGPIQLGTKFPLPCPIAGIRTNELSEKTVRVQPFWIAKTCVSNKEFEQFNPHHLRSPTSPDDNSPVTEVTYPEALSYAKWLSDIVGYTLLLPREIEWIYAAGPPGWIYPYKRGPKPVPKSANTHTSGLHRTLPVSDPRYGTNLHGLYHMAGNIQEMTREVYEASGNDLFCSNGIYCITKGGDFGHCDYSARICTRGMFDIAARCTRTGFRLAAYF